MTYEEINQKYDLGEITPRMNALLSVLLSSDDYEDEILDLLENNLYEDNISITLNGGEFKVMTDGEFEEICRSYAEDVVDEHKYMFNRSAFSDLEQYVDWNCFIKDEAETYSENYEEYEDCGFLGSSFDYNIYKVN